MIFEQFTTSKRKNVAYLIGDEDSRRMAVVDMGYKPQVIFNRVSELRGKLEYMLVTHGHRDHTGTPAAIAKMRKATGAKLAAYKTNGHLTTCDVPLDDGDEFRMGGNRVDVIHTPGHTYDSVCFLINDHKLLTGDTLYVGGAPKGENKRRLYNSLHEVVMKLPDEIEIWPGHDVGPKPSSTVDHERRNNAVLQMDFQDFCDRRWNGKRWEV